MVRAIDFSSRLSTADEETKQGSFELKKREKPMLAFASVLYFFAFLDQHFCHTDSPVALVVVSIV